MSTLTNRQKWIVFMAIWLVVSCIILTGSFRFSSDDWWWTATYTALITFATGVTVLIGTSKQATANGGTGRRTKDDLSKPEA
jgi:hypothetical protein